MRLFLLLFSKFWTPVLSSSTAVPEGTFCEASGRVWSSFTLPVFPACASLIFFTVHLSSCLLPSHFQDIFESFLLAYCIYIHKCSTGEHQGISSFDCTSTCYLQLSVAPTPKFLPFPKCTCPFTPLSLCKKPGFPFLQWPSPSGELIRLLCLMLLQSWLLPVTCWSGFLAALLMVVI